MPQGAKSIPIKTGADKSDLKLKKSFFKYLKLI
jgi:hypothetical protein